MIFKQCCNLSKQRQHGEASSVPASASEEMKTVRTLCGEYNEEDIYNMDETGLFWRQAPHSGFATQPRPGVRKDKSRITPAVCVNSTGSDKVPAWIIGLAKDPRSLRGLNIQALGCVWNSNKKSWMTSLVKREWLLSFYSHIGNQRSVLLLLDNFSAHIQEVELTPPPSLKQAIEALETVLSWEEYSEGSRREDIQVLEGLERRLKIMSHNQRKQQTLDSWLI